MNIDCIDCVTGMKRLDKGTVDLVFADPPFNIGYEYDVYHDRRQRDQYLDWSKQWMTEVGRLLKPDGTFWLAIGDEYAAELKIIAQNDIGFTCRSWVVWYYTFGVNCKRKFSRSHTHLFHFVKNPKQFTFNPDEIRVPSARQLVYGDSRAKKSGRLPDDTWILRPQETEFDPLNDTWHVPRVCGTFKERVRWHSCQMPQQVMDRIIRVSTNAGDSILDPFIGSGTTAVVAKRLNRICVGFDISENYVKKAKERIAAAERSKFPNDETRLAYKELVDDDLVRAFWEEQAEDALDVLAAHETEDEAVADLATRIADRIDDPDVDYMDIAERFIEDAIERR